jgi:hypothetical protein
VTAPVQVFVFGANLAGRHGKGAALHAAQYWGAERGSGYGWQGFGSKGTSYAIPTKDRQLRPLPLSEIAKYAADFAREAALWPDRQFILTRVGCGLAGYTDAQIAPLFRGLSPNVTPPEEWRIHL